MHFTVVFESYEACDLSFGLVFVPCPVWKQGKREIKNLHPSDPSFRPGDLVPLIELERIEDQLAPGKRNAVVLVHEEGYGTQADLETLCRDLRESRFVTQIIEFPF